MRSRREKEQICAWCGSPKTARWFWDTASSHSYCSQECLIAGTRTPEKRRKRCLKGGSVGIVFGILFGIMFSDLAYYGLNLFMSILGGIVIFTLLFGCVVSIEEIQAEDYRRRLPRGSRRQIEIAELETAVASISCPRCDADVDSLKVKPNGYYHCEYCGADVKLPDWVRKI